MNKKELKSILMSMKTPENENSVNYLLGKIDMQDEIAIQKAILMLGNKEENIRRILVKKIEERQQKKREISN